jgi:predicted acylesterase/phospholipase RssA
MRDGPPRARVVPRCAAARGLAHIGIIEAIEQAGYEVRSIAGTSMGALVGGIYAAGRLDVYTRWVTALSRIDVIRLLDFAYDRRGLFKGEKIINLLKDLIGDHEITRLPISFTAVATDLKAQKEVWFNRGPLFDAIRASISVPTIFTPYEYQGMQLVDGALINPIPIAPTLHDKTDVTVAVNLPRPSRPSGSITGGSRSSSRRSIKGASSAPPATSGSSTSPPAAWMRCRPSSRAFGSRPTCRMSTSRSPATSAPSTSSTAPAS